MTGAISVDAKNEYSKVLLKFLSDITTDRGVYFYKDTDKSIVLGSVEHGFRVPAGNEVLLKGIATPTYDTEAANKYYADLQTRNRNLLDNWYFPATINQRNQTVYTNGYTIDRWALWDGSGSLTVDANNGYVWLKSNSTPGYVSYVQRMENFPYLEGKLVTCSVLTTEGLFSGSQVLRYESSERFFNTSTIAADAYPAGVRIFAFVGGGVKLIAAKLELGSVQTLAHKEGDTWVLNDPPPNFQQELAKCQRFYQRPAGASVWAIVGFAITDGSTTCAVWIPYSVPMRAVPTLVFSGLCVGSVPLTNIAIDQAGFNSLTYAGTLSSAVPSGIYPVRLLGSGYLELDANL